MAKADLEVIGFSQTVIRNIAAASTRFFAGEPIHSLATSSSGAASVNTYVVAAADTPVIGTHRFGGIAIANALVNASSAVIAQKVQVSAPIPWLGRIRGKGEVAANIDTAAELLAIVGDYVLIDYNATGSVTGGPLYTVKDTASADTSGLEIVDGNIFRGTLDVTVDGRSYRHDVV